jgi:hypothetical protein
MPPGRDHRELLTATGATNWPTAQRHDAQVSGWRVVPTSCSKIAHRCRTGQAVLGLQAAGARIHALAPIRRGDGIQLVRGPGRGAPHKRQVAHEVVADVDMQPRSVVVLGPGTIPKTPSASCAARTRCLSLANPVASFENGNCWPQSAARRSIDRVAEGRGPQTETACAAKRLLSLQGASTRVSGRSRYPWLSACSSLPWLSFLGSPLPSP